MGLRAIITFAATAMLLVCAPANSSAYSVLAHEALIDDAWMQQIAPLLRQRFPRASAQAIQEARAYAYGGSLIQDLGYYPFGSHFFSNLVHYIRSGDFVEALIGEAHNVNEYAFALGALAHYASDNAGHPIAVNRVVPIMYPKLRAKYGEKVLYSDSPARHIMVEFAFDVLQVARGHFKSDAYQELIGFEVAKPLLERAFRDTYGLELKEVFGSVDLALGSYRRAASQFIPDVTRVAWREKRDEILARTPDVTEGDFVYSMTALEYDMRFGTTYRKPGLFARIVVAIFKVIPRFGPFKPLAFEPLTADTERMFLDSFTAAHERFDAMLQQLRANRRVSLRDTDLDTGQLPALGVNRLADDTYKDLRKKLERRKFEGVSPELRAALDAQFRAHDAASRRPSGAPR